MAGDRPIATVSVKRDLQVKILGRSKKVHVHEPIDISPAPDWARVTEIRYLFATAIPQATINDVKSGKNKFPISDPKAFP